MRPADREAVSVELARSVGFVVEPGEIDVGRSARAAKDLYFPDKRRQPREPGFDQAVTLAARIWVLERGNRYEKGNVYRGSKNEAKDLPTYPMQVFIAELVERALPSDALSRRNATPNVAATHDDVLRMVDTSLRKHDENLREARIDGRIRAAPNDP